MKLAIALSLFLCMMPATQAHDVDARIAVVSPEGSHKMLSWTQLKALPQSTEVGDNHGSKHSYEGVSLLLVLEAGGIAPTRTLRRDLLRRVVTVEGADGYRAGFMLSELDPTIGGKLVLLVAHEDGKPLARDDGPLRLVVPSDRRPARWVRQVVRITVEDVGKADAPPAADAGSVAGREQR